MKSGFLLPDSCTKPKNSQSHARTQSSRSNSVGVDSQSCDVLPSHVDLWWDRLFWNDYGDHRYEHEPSSTITRVLAKHGYSETWQVTDLPSKLTVVSRIEAEHLQREARLKYELARDRFSLFMWHQQAINDLPFLAGCEWCGLPTGNFCECCSRTYICNDCENEFHSCKVCSA